MKDCYNSSEVSIMATTITIRNNTLYLNNNLIYFDYSVESVIIHENKVLVLLDVPTNSNETSNIFLVNMNAEIVWRIQAVKDKYPQRKNTTPFVGISIINNSLIANDFFGLRYLISIKDGSIIDTVSGTRPW